MGRLEVACRRFAVSSGIRQEPGSFASCVLPRGSAGTRKGLLALVTEPAGEHPALATGACKLVQEVVTNHYYTNDFVSITSGLLRAVDAANSALLEQNYAGALRPAVGAALSSNVAVQAGGTRSRSAQVGLTAILLRPDGAGIYIAQMAPTQAYIVHNGILSALPDPGSWHRGGKVAVMLRKVPTPSEANELDDAEQSDLDGPVPQVSLPTLPLGSGPGVDIDLAFRRVEPGDVIAIVSGSLARHLDKPFTEEILSSGDADYIIDALYDLSTEHGLAASHACVLQLGAETTSGVDMDWLLPLPGPGMLGTATGSEPIENPSTGEEVHVDPLGNILKGPRQWFAKRRGTAESTAAEPTEGYTGEPEAFNHVAVPFDETATEFKPDFPSGFDEEDAGYGPHTVLSDGGEETDAAAMAAPLPPTQILLQHSLDVPPYKAQQAEPAPQEYGATELEFDGWEDTPPVLSESLYEPEGWQQTPLPPWLQPRADEAAAWPSGSAQTLVEDESPPSGSVIRRRTVSGPGVFNAPRLFDEAEDEEDVFSQALVAPTIAAPTLPVDEPLPTDEAVRRPTGAGISEAVSKSLDAVSATVRSVAAKTRGGLSVGAGRAVIPYRVLIAAALVLLVAVLAFSVVQGGGNAKHNEAARVLAQAKQDETLGNQPNAPGEERLANLQKALDGARSALTIDPASAEAALLATQVQADLDKLQGITRIETTLLFDLSGAAASAGGDEAAASAAPVTGTSQLANIIIQGSDAYVLDRAHGKLFRCRISSRECSAVLQTGDSAGGQKVGPLLALTSRVGNPTVLDANKVAYVYSADTSAWQANTLGAAGTLDKPVDLASYDGNLYLLLPGQGQIAKYASGSYSADPDHWIKDPASSEQLKGAVAFAIDGAIYALTADGKVLVMQGGKVTRTIAAKFPDGSQAPTGLFTNTDLQGLYVLDSASATIVRMNKEGLVLSTLRPADGAVSPVSALAVDEGRGKLYLLQGGKVYEAGLTVRAASPASQSHAAPADQSSSGPVVQPTAEP